MTLASPRRSMPAFRALVATSLAAALLIVVGQSSGHAATATPAPTVAPPHILWPKGQAPATATAAATAAPDPAQYNNLIFHGGVVQHVPAVYLVYWGTEWKDGFTTGDSQATYTSA